MIAIWARKCLDSSIFAPKQRSCIGRDLVALRKSHTPSFVTSAVVIPAEHEQSIAPSLAKLRVDVGRRSSDTVHWRNLKSHSQRLHAAKTLGAQGELVVSTVLVCKDHLPPAALDEDQAYLYTLRLLLERLSWLARDVAPVSSQALAPRRPP